MSLQLETEDNLDTMTTTVTTTSVPQLTTWHSMNGPDITWTPAVVFRIAAVLVLMLLTLLGNVITLLGNVIVIITIVSCAELRKKRVNSFILNLAVGDLMVCFVSMPLDIVLAMVGQWTLGNAACKLLIYGHIMAVAFTIFLLTALSIDRYQVKS